MNWGRLAWNVLRHAVGISDLLLGLLAAYTNYEVLRVWFFHIRIDPDFTLLSRVSAPYLLVVSAILGVSSVGALLRSRIAAVALLMCVAIFAYLGLLEGVFEIHGIASGDFHFQWPQTIGDWVHLALDMGLGWIVWLALNCWCFAGQLISRPKAS